MDNPDFHVERRSARGLIRIALLVAGLFIGIAPVLAGAAGAQGVPTLRATAAAGSTTLPAGHNSASDFIKLSDEIDQCSGQLYVLSSDHGWVKITRGVKTSVNVSVDNDGYWYWNCGSSKEKSRSGSDAKLYVNYLHVYHSLEGRQINWGCYHKSS
jgi:hypothetical protein